jgi:hypothetical protein
VSEYPASKFIEFYLRIRRKAGHIDFQYLDMMRWSEYSPVFVELSLAILTRDVDRFYNFLRGFATDTARVNRNGVPSLFSVGFVEEALRFFQA